MPDYEVKHLASQRTATILKGCDNILEARDKYARQNGYKDWGTWVRKYKENRHTDLNKPPFTFKKKD